MGEFLFKSHVNNTFFFTGHLIFCGHPACGYGRGHTESRSARLWCRSADTAVSFPQEQQGLTLLMAAWPSQSSFLPHPAITPTTNAGIHISVFPSCSLLTSHFCCPICSGDLPPPRDLAVWCWSQPVPRLQGHGRHRSFLPLRKFLYSHLW